MKSLAWRIYIRCSEQTRSSSSTFQIITPKGNGLIGNTSSTYWQPCNQITYGSSLSMLICSVWPVKVKCSRVSQSRWLNIGRSSWRPCLIYPVSNSSYILLTWLILLEKHGKTLDLLKTKSKPIPEKKKRKTVPIKGSFADYMDSKKKS